MPGFDGNGPMGAGPMTGGTRGRCNFANTVERPMTVSPGYGRKFGGSYGFGRRRGCFGRNVAMNQPVYANNPAVELSMLKQQADSAKAQLDSINEKIAELEQTD